MTAAAALALVESRLSALALDRDSKMAEALGVLRAKVTTKPRKTKTKGCPLAAAVVKACRRPSSWSEGPRGSLQESWYLDTFGPEGSPEREAQRERLRALPTYAQFAYEGIPASVKGDDAQRTFLLARMGQFELDDTADAAAAERRREAELARMRRERVEREAKVSAPLGARGRRLTRRGRLVYAPRRDPQTERKGDEPHVRSSTEGFGRMRRRHQT